MYFETLHLTDHSLLFMTNDRFQSKLTKGLFFFIILCQYGMSTYKFYLQLNLNVVELLYKLIKIFEVYNNYDQNLYN